MTRTFCRTFNPEKCSGLCFFYITLKLIFMYSGLFIIPAARNLSVFHRILLRAVPLTESFAVILNKENRQAVLKILRKLHALELFHLRPENLSLSCIFRQLSTVVACPVKKCQISVITLRIAPVNHSTVF